ncbi:MAG: Eco57I restriction-modification methylase domain-containing protein [Nitrospirae bacterium]|nr:Eco57I restriction-modification methylase domain-containing protein [Nitrospirota bacterium]
MKEFLQRTFENEFNKALYKGLVLNLFNHFDFSREHSLKQYFTEDEKQKIKDFIYLGTYEDIEKKCLDVLTVELKSSSKVERARSLQRNLIGKYLKTNLKDSALVAFYSKVNPDWRLSFVKMDYRLDEKGVKVEIGTPPKRYSFLVGKTEPSHTAQKQLLPLLDDRKVPSVEEIEKAFSIEKVTREFYTEIAKKFTELVGGERKIGSRKIVEAGQLKYPKPSDILRKEFAVRLIGRLMFCWFLKKKKSDAGVPLIPNVLLSSDAIIQYPDYYHSLLEPLFFRVLNTPVENRDKSVKHGFWNDIPFLNGGLFEHHLHDYYEIYYESGISKYINTLRIPDEWFLDLFKIFELYNFTIDESTTIDIDISVDPEMLGRIFENLLAEINPETGETARKSTGSYYTPRPIVEYMVDESLKQYLKTQLYSLRHSELVSESKEMLNQVQHDGAVSRHSALDAESSPSSLDSQVPPGVRQASKPENDKQEIDQKLSRLLSYGDYDVDLSESQKDAIIDALDRVKIIDPACGSGAFPMGILHKMLLILQKIDPQSKKWLSRKLSRIDNKLLRHEVEAKLKRENWDYIHKLGIIQSSIYGVDIQPIAVEISKLRFFLSLIVDEKVDDTKPNRGIVPLPNLEFKFVAANSLIGLPQMARFSQMEMFEARDDINRLKDLRDAYFTSYGTEKRSIESEFQEIQGKMYEYAVKEMATHKKTLETQTLKLSQWKPFTDESSSWFDPEWMFGIKNPSLLAGESKGEGGFDIVIGNPPYIPIAKLPSETAAILSKQLYETFSKDADVYCLFYEKGINLLRQYGCLCYISSNRFCFTNYGIGLRKYMSQKNLLQLINFNEINVFESANVGSLVALIQNTHFSNSPILIYESKGEYIGDLIKDGKKLKREFYRDNQWNFEEGNIQNLKFKIGKRGVPFSKWEGISINRGITTGLNDVFIISESLRNEIIKEDPKSIEIIRPVLRGANIKRYKILSPKEYLIYMYSGIKIEAYPGVYNYLKKHKKLLEEVYEAKHGLKKWYELRKCSYYDKFFKPKLVWTRLSNQNAFAISLNGEFTVDSSSFAVSEDINYLAAILNSKIILFYIKLGSVIWGKDGIKWFGNHFDNIPIPNISRKEQQPLISLVDQILAAKQKDPNADTSALEREIDKMVYDLYGLTPEEIEIVEGNTRGIKA